MNAIQKTEFKEISPYGWVMEHYEDLAKAYPEIIKKYE